MLFVCAFQMTRTRIRMSVSGGQANRLYDIRNAINHGDIDAENPTEILRVESRLRRLWMIVWRMFGLFVPFPAPADSRLTEER